MREIITALLVSVGAFVILLTGIGLARMPDFFTRIQCATKSSTLGVSCMLLAVAVHSGELDIVARAIAIIVLVLLTTPIAAHAIGRAAYYRGVELWEGTVRDELDEYERSRERRGADARDKREDA